MAGINQRCGNCTTIIPLWDTHILCKGCRPCTAIRYKDCAICSSWDEPTWALYLETATPVPQGDHDTAPSSPGEVNAEFAQPAWYIQAQKDQMAIFQKLITSVLPPAKSTKKKAQKKAPTQRKVKGSTAPSATVTSAPSATVTSATRLLLRPRLLPLVRQGPIPLGTSTLRLTFLPMTQL